MKCQINNCEGIALVSYGSKWICGSCMVKILEKKKAREQREMDELGEELK